MTESKSTKPRWRIFYTIAPLLLLIVCLVGINLFNWWRQQALLTNDGGGETAVLDQQPNQTIAITTPSPVQTDSTTIPPDTTTPSATPYVPPTFPPETHIQLLGPPGDSIFSKNQPLTFYWQWPLSLAEDQFFTVTLFVDDQQFDIGSVNEPNLGPGYRWQLNPISIPDSAEMIQWQIQLFSQNSDTPLMISESRILSLR